MRKHLSKTLLRDTVVLVICIFITYIIFYNFVSELLIRFMSPSMSLYIGMMVFVTTVLYILAALYFGLSIGFYCIIAKFKLGERHLNIKLSDGKC
jgi:hypothetical protein